MKKTLRKIVDGFFDLPMVKKLSMKTYHFFNDRITQWLAEEKSRQVTLHEGARLLPACDIHNNQSNPGQIIIGARTLVTGELLVFAHGGKIEIGEDCYIGRNTTIRSAAAIQIGNNVLIAHNCNITDTTAHEEDHLERAATYRHIAQYGLPTQPYNVIEKPVVIEDYAWLSFNVSVLQGVRVGRGAIVAAGSVVTKDVAPFTLVGGIPAKFIRELSSVDEDGLPS